MNFDVVVLGGGTAGWLTGLYIKRYWPKLKIAIVENPKKPPIIAGESGTTTFVDLLQAIDIDIKDFVKKVNATPKLGGKFTNWNGVGTEFIHCLQTDYAPWLDGWTDYVNNEVDEPVMLSQLTRILQREREKEIYLKTLIGNDTPLTEAFYAHQFIKEQKVPFGHPTVDLPVRAMWHFESRSTAAYLKEKGIERGIEIIEGEYQNSKQDSKGNISSILLDEDRELFATWFFDCSGFARLLLDKVLKEPVIDYTNYFPARSVIAWWDKPCYCVTTNAIAMKYGWSWNINLRHRSGNGYLYDPDHLTYDQALQEIESTFGKVEPIANFSFQPGMMRNTWKNNVIAIGLSNGFLEPLEANGVAVIIESLYALHDHWHPSEPNYVSQRFNDRVWQVTEDIKDFLALHYRGQRRDTEFWISHGNDDYRIPDTLKNKLEDWKTWYAKGGSEPTFNGYSPTAWLMVLQGLRVFDHSKIQEIYKNVLPVSENVLNNNITRYRELVAPFLTIEEWVQEFDKY